MELTQSSWKRYSAHPTFSYASIPLKIQIIHPSVLRMGGKSSGFLHHNALGLAENLQVLISNSWKLLSHQRSPQQRINVEYLIENPIKMTKTIWWWNLVEVGRKCEPRIAFASKGLDKSWKDQIAGIKTYTGFLVVINQKACSEYKENSLQINHHWILTRFNTDEDPQGHWL